MPDQPALTVRYPGPPDLFKLEHLARRLNQMWKTWDAADPVERPPIYALADPDGLTFEEAFRQLDDQLCPPVAVAGEKK